MLVPIRYFPLLLAVMMLSFCSDPVEPPVKERELGDPIQTEPIPDTTSHEYIWESYVFGNAPGSWFHDVYAVNDTIAYAVGLIIFEDSTHRIYNAVKWDGNNWEMIQIPIRAYDDTLGTSYSKLRSVWGDGPNNYAFATTGPIVYHDGTTYITDKWFKKQHDASIWEFWGNEDDRWFVGHYGAITHGTGRTYVIEPKLTDLHLTGVWGNKKEIWVVADYWLNQESLVLKRKNGKWENMNRWTIADETQSTRNVWCDEIGSEPGGFVGLVGAGLIYYDSIWNSAPREVLSGGGFGVLSLGVNNIHGTGRNNVFGVGNQGLVVHYNGKSWVYYPELLDKYSGYFGVSVTENKVFLAGWEGSLAKMTVGTRK